MAVSKLLQHFKMYYSAARMNEEPLHNIRIHSSDIFCQLHHLFLPVLSLKGIYHPWCLSALCLPKLFFQQTTKIYITALFRVHFNLLGNYSRDISSYSVLLMRQRDVTSLAFSHFKFCAIRSETYKKMIWLIWLSGMMATAWNIYIYICISASIDFFCRGRKHTDA